MQTSVKRNFNQISYYSSYNFLSFEWLHDFDFIIWYWHVYFSKGTLKETFTRKFSKYGKRTHFFYFGHFVLFSSSRVPM